MRGLCISTATQKMGEGPLPSLCWPAPAAYQGPSATGEPREGLSLPEDAHTHGTPDLNDNGQVVRRSGGLGGWPFEAGQSATQWPLHLGLAGHLAIAV